MTRERYYSKVDEAQERVIGVALARAWGLSYAPTRTGRGEHREGEQCDGRLIRGDRLIVLAEFKARAFPWGKFPTVVLSEHKARAVVRQAGAGVAPVLAIKTADEVVRWCDLRITLGLDAREGGRTVQTRDEYDIERCFYIPAGWFWTLERRPYEVQPKQPGAAITRPLHVSEIRW